MEPAAGGLHACALRVPTCYPTELTAPTTSCCSCSDLRQNGRFDAPDRLFWSIADTWKSVLTLPSDVKVRRAADAARWQQAFNWPLHASCLRGSLNLANLLISLISWQELVPEFYSNDPSFLVGAFNGSCMPLGQVLGAAKQRPCRSSSFWPALPTHTLRLAPRLCRSSTSGA